LNWVGRPDAPGRGGRDQEVSLISDKITINCAPLV
jgi:hypothetical protein